MVLAQGAPYPPQVRLSCHQLESCCLDPGSSLDAHFGVLPRLQTREWYAVFVFSWTIDNRVVQSCDVECQNKLGNEPEDFTLSEMASQQDETSATKQAVCRARHA